MRLSREARSMKSPQVWCIWLPSPSIHCSPLTRTVQCTWRRPSRSSGWSSLVVTRYGPRLVALSLPLAGPSRHAISSNCRSRQLQSLKITNPAMYGSAHIGAFATDDAAELQLVVQPFGGRWIGHFVVRTEDAQRIGKVKDRQAVPRL